MTDTTALGMEDEEATGYEQGAGEDAKTDPPPRPSRTERRWRTPQFQPGQTHLGLPTCACGATKFATEIDFRPGSGDCCGNAGRGLGTGQQRGGKHMRRVMERACLAVRRPSEGRTLTAPLARERNPYCLERMPTRHGDFR